MGQLNEPPPFPIKIPMTFGQWVERFMDGWVFWLPAIITSFAAATPVSPGFLDLLGLPTEINWLVGGLSGVLWFMAWSRFRASCSITEEGLAIRSDVRRRLLRWEDIGDIAWIETPDTYVAKMRVDVGPRSFCWPGTKAFWQEHRPVVRRLLNQHKSRGEERLLAAFAFGACEPDQLWMGGLLSIVGIGGLASMSQKHPKHLVVGLLMCAFFAIYGLRELVIQLLAPRIRYYLSRAEIRAEGPLYRKSITLSEVREVRLSTAHGTLPWKPRYASIPPFTRCKLIGPAGRMTVYSHSHKAISAIVRRCRNAHVVHRRF